MQRQKRGTRIWVKLVLGISIVLVAGWSTLIYIAAKEQEKTAIQQSHDFAESAHQMSMAALVFMKSTRTIKQRALYLDQIKQSTGVKDLRIIRGEPVIHQMGEGTEDEMRTDETEREVLKTGNPFFQVQHTDRGEVLKAVIPAISSTNYLGKNCIEGCHDEFPAGTVLGAVSMNVPLDKVKANVGRSVSLIALVALALTAISLVFIYLAVTRIVVRPISAMTRSLEDISQGAGDLTRRLEVQSGDEIGRAAEAFNRMMEHLRTLVSRINDNAIHLAEASQELRASTGEIAQSSAAQSDKTASTAAGMEQMAVSISSVAASSDEVKTLSERSLQSTQKGMSHLDDLGKRLAQVEEAVGRITDTVNHFVSSTASISAMTQQVKEIAEQTNLLALNAAIEAARAGEYGRGFAVVADEVRKLAEKSGHSASEIDAITQQLGQESGNVKAAIDLGLQVLRQSKSAMDSVARVIDEANQAVVEVAKGMNAINAATDEQQQSSTMVARNVESIAELAEKNSHAIENVANAVNHLTALAESLQQETGKFKT